MADRSWCRRRSWTSLGSRLPSQVSLRDLGGIRLKDLAAPEHVYQVVHPRLRQDFPALRSLESTPNNLPQQLTSFVGRDREIAEAATLLKETRLLTLLGMGGLGKTRLSLQIAADALDDHPDGIWFLDLAPIRDAALVESVAAQTLGVQEEPGRPLKQTLCAHVRQRRLLIIIDNCEHLVEACADLANALLRAGSEVRIIATSREALRVPGEQTYPVLPLPVPDRDAGLDVVARSDAVQLFVDRARLRKPGFSLTERDAPSIAELCSRLEGIPLALELAAARLRTLSVAEINVRLRDRFKLLTGGGSVLLERQQTLRALVDWSYDLLDDNERLLFDRLSIFRGGFDLEAAEVVCGSEPLAPDEVLDVVSSLVDKSLVMADQQGETTRYRTLETIREYAREKLVARGELAATATRHCDHFLTVAKAGNRGIKGREQARWTRRLEAELDNLRAAIALALGGGVDPVLVGEVRSGTSGILVSCAATRPRDAATSAPRSRSRPSRQSDVAQGHALYVGAALAQSQGHHAEARSMLEQCLALRRAMGSPVDIAATLSTLSLVLLDTGDPVGARERELEALALFRQLGDRIGEAIGLLHLGQICIYIADDLQARVYLEQCLAIARDLEHCEIQSECLRLLGGISLEAGDVSGAREWFMRSLEACKGAGDRRDEATSLWWMSKADAAAGDLALAQEHIATALEALAAFEMNAEILGCLEDQASLARGRGEAEAAARLLGAAQAHRERLDLARPPRSQQRWRDEVAATRGQLDAAAFDAAWSAGRQWELREAVKRALA